MKTIDLPFPDERAVCLFCQRRLVNRKGKFDGLQLCTSAGIAILCCKKHAVVGDMIISIVNVKLRDFALAQSVIKGN